jgi:peroxiredoxin Q/BCP
VKTLTAGADAPDFDLPDQDGERVQLSELVRKGPVVLFFYPAANTPTCTKEACTFRDLASEYAEAGVQRVGISTDSVEKQSGFSQKFGFDYPLLADADGAVTKAYGVRRGLVGVAKRVTFVIDEARQIREVISSEFNGDIHATDALAAARRLAG